MASTDVNYGSEIPPGYEGRNGALVTINDRVPQVPALPWPYSTVTPRPEILSSA